jgi:hypothetical protein
LHPFVKIARCPKEVGYFHSSNSFSVCNSSLFPTEFCFMDRLNLVLLQEGRATSRLQEIFPVVRVFTAGSLIRCNDSHYRAGFNWQYENKVHSVLTAVNKLWITFELCLVLKKPPGYKRRSESRDLNFARGEIPARVGLHQKSKPPGIFLYWATLQGRIVRRRWEIPGTG